MLLFSGNVSTIKAELVINTGILSKNYLCELMRFFDSFIQSFFLSKFWIEINFKKSYEII